MKEKKRMISEAARELGLETYHLRTWEDEFGLLIPRNEKGYRCYGDKEIHTFQKIRDMKEEGLDAEQIKQKLSGNIIPFPKENPAASAEKMAHFQNVMVKIMGQAIRQQKEFLEKEITEKISKEMKEQFRIREREEERRYQKLDEMIRIQQKTREEIAATKEKRRILFWHRKRREK
ncbi:helix-turn-helix domain-containing protein [Anaerostipes sp. MSJ-23]|uniref:helix-turn-helix domain-containing protein n=1 Tax=unclassified Anaerostipes TaxID=2635253 RepID=UPI001C11DEA0|nr:helix-turn-helix domain-containing protein [Anaerostipes sp. MSJ-23]MBU5459607.1 helix-turn-helix domain-containing protein [Anaerostipes sp. MSJ-23]